jgi:iron complex transport system ATP-binding protein
VVLREVSLEVRSGRVLVLAGPNGAGKSTLLKVLAGLVRLERGRGTVQLAGRELGAWSPEERAERIAYVAQSPSAAFGFAVREVVGFGLPERTPLEGGAGQRAVDEALARVGLKECSGKAFAHLSAGQQQRAALARALVQVCAGRQDADRAEGSLDGKVVLADEPTSAQDPHHAVKTILLLRDLARRGAAVVMVMHDLSLALRAADDAGLLACDGRLAAVGEAAEVLSPARLEEVFGVDFVVAKTTRGSAALIAGEAHADTGAGSLPSDETLMRGS